MSRIYTHELTEKHWVDVHYNYTPGEPDQPYDSNREPGTQGSPATVEITAIRCLCTDPNGNFHNVDILPYIEVCDELNTWDLEEKILESHED